jgi:hypothetical protein
LSDAPEIRMFKTHETLFTQPRASLCENSGAVGGSESSR